MVTVVDIFIVSLTCTGLQNHHPQLTALPRHTELKILSLPPHRSQPWRTPMVTTQKQVHFATSPRSAERDSPSQLPVIRSSPSYLSQNYRSNSNSDGGSTNGSSSLSGPSSIDSVLYDDTLVVIEKSNHELEQRLGRGDKHQPNSVNRTQISNNRVDTIHNNRHLDQEIIYEENMSDM